MAEEPLKSTMLIMVESDANHNKFYDIKLMPNNNVLARWGRVGASGQSKTFTGGERVYQSTIAAKKKKGYVEVAVLADTAGQAPSSATTQLSEIAKNTLIKPGVLNPILEQLVERLVRINKHEIIETSGGLIKVNTDGRIATPLGLIQADSISRAESLLGRFQRASGSDRYRLAEEYLTLIPQRVPKVKVWADDEMNTSSAFVRQQTFLTQLRDSVDFYNAQVKKAATTKDTDDTQTLQDKYKDLFRFNVDVLDEKDPTYAEIVQRYERTKNMQHSSRSLHVKRIFTLYDQQNLAAYEDILGRIGNERHLWHGTRAFNVLSILRKGLFVPPTSGSNINITGRMFGNGIYLSDQSTKSLNYSYGYWGGGTRESNCFMFMAKVAMGHEFRPKFWDATSYKKATTGVGLSGKPFHSISVKGGTCGVMNNEIVIWNSDQVSLRYLVEFDS